MSFNQVNLFLNESAKKAALEKNIKCAHFLKNITFPPFDGSYGFLVWQLTQKRKSDIIFTDFDEESFEKCQNIETPIVFVKQDKLSSHGRAIHSISRKYFRKPIFEKGQKSYYKKAAEYIKEADIKQILVWSTLDCGVHLRQHLPDREINFALRLYEHDCKDEFFNTYDHIVTQTRGQIDNAFRRLYQLNPCIHVIPNGVEVDLFQVPSHDEKEYAKEKFNLPKDKKIVIFPSKLQPNKGTHYMEQWVKFVEKENLNIHFFIVGRVAERVKGQHKENILKCFSESPNVTWIKGIGRMDMPQAYQAADLSLMPGTWREGFSMSSIESMASGLPVMATAEGCFPEIIRHDYNGFLCPLNNLLHSVKDKLIAIQNMNQELKEMGQNARNYVVTKLPRNKSLQNFDNFLNGHYWDIDSDMSVD